MTRLILLRKTKKDVMMIFGCFHTMRFSLSRNYILNVEVWELDNIILPIYYHTQKGFGKTRKKQNHRDEPNG